MTMIPTEQQQQQPNLSTTSYSLSPSTSHQPVLDPNSDTIATTGPGTLFISSSITPPSPSTTPSITPINITTDDATSQAVYEPSTTDSSDISTVHSTITKTNNSDPNLNTNSGDTGQIVAPTPPPSIVTIPSSPSSSSSTTNNNNYQNNPHPYLPPSSTPYRRAYPTNHQHPHKFPNQYQLLYQPNKHYAYKNHPSSLSTASSTSMRSNNSWPPKYHNNSYEKVPIPHPPHYIAHDAFGKTNRQVNFIINSRNHYF